MFKRVTVRVSDRRASRDFYDIVLSPLGLSRESTPRDLDAWNAFSIRQADEGHLPTRALHVAFGARSRDQVEEFWRTGVQAGHRSDGDPGPRPRYHPDYYGAFLLDPDGNSVEAVFGHRTDTTGDAIDHLWLGVTDIDRSRRFFEVIAPALELKVVDASLPGLVAVAASNRHFILVADGRPPTSHLDLTFPASSPDAIAAFRSAATAAGHPEQDTSDERRQALPDNRNAVIRDPDGNTIRVAIGLEHTRCPQGAT